MVSFGSAVHTNRAGIVNISSQNRNVNPHYLFRIITVIIGGADGVHDGFLHGSIRLHVEIAFGASGILSRQTSARQQVNRRGIGLLYQFNPGTKAYFIT